LKKDASSSRQPHWEGRTLGNCRKGQQEEPKEKAFSISSESGLSLQKSTCKKVQRELTEGERTSSQASSTDLKKERKTKKKRTKTYKMACSISE
jgi:hypothetical protein